MQRNVLFIIAQLKPKLHYFNLLCICCTTYRTTNPQQIESCTTNPQHFDMSTCFLLSILDCFSIVMQ